MEKWFPMYYLLLAIEAFVGILFAIETDQFFFIKFYLVKDNLIL